MTLILSTRKTADGSKVDKTKKSTSLEDCKLSKAPEDGFIGIGRIKTKRIKTKKFTLGGIAENIEESQISDKDTCRED